MDKTDTVGKSKPATFTWPWGWTTKTKNRVWGAVFLLGICAVIDVFLVLLAEALTLKPGQNPIPLLSMAFLGNWIRFGLAGIGLYLIWFTKRVFGWVEQFTREKEFKHTTIAALTASFVWVVCVVNIFLYLIQIAHGI